MKKHGAVLDMRNDQLSFWPGHYQHDIALRLLAAEPQAEKSRDKHTKKSCAEEPNAGKPMKILKQSMNELPELLPHFFPSTRGVSKVISAVGRKITPEKKKPDGIPLKPKVEVEDERNESKTRKPSVERADSKPLDLAFIGGASFMHLAKSKKQKAEIFAISMQDIKYQLNKRTKPPTDPKTVVPTEYHDFLDVFSKEISDTLRLYRKHDHKIELLKDQNLGDLGHSAL